MSRDEIINSIYTDKKLLSVIRRVKSRTSGLMDWEDLLHDSIIELSMLPEQKIIDLHTNNELGKFMYGVASHLCNNKYKQFNKNNLILSSDETSDVAEVEHESVSDEFYEFCETIATGNKFPEAVRLSAKIVQGYLLYIPQDGKKSYRGFQKQSNIHFCSTASAVKKMRELFIKYEENSISI